MIKTSEIERRVVAIADRVLAGGRVEDSRVEAKRVAPAAEKAAKRLAAHANVAAGEPILWIIGLDEDDHKIYPVELEPASWYRQVAAEFDERIAPQLLTDIYVPVEGGSLWALYFDTTRSPYVVKMSGGGGDWIVPVRIGTDTRTARRIDLLRLLNVAALRPTIDVVGAKAEFENSTPQQSNLHVRVLTYWTPIGIDPMVVPFHLCRGELSAGDRRVVVTRVSLQPRLVNIVDARGSVRQESANASVRYSAEDCVVLGHASLLLRGVAFLRPDALIREDEPNCIFTLSIAGRQDDNTVAAGPLKLLPHSGEKILRWAVGEHDRVWEPT